MSDDVPEIGVAPPAVEVPRPEDLFRHRIIGRAVAFGCAAVVLIVVAALLGGVVGIWRWALQ